MIIVAGEQLEHGSLRDGKCKSKKKRTRSRPDLWSGYSSASSNYGWLKAETKKPRAISDIEWVQNYIGSSSHHASSVHGQLRIYFTREEDPQRRGKTKIDAIDPNSQSAQFRQANPRKMRNSDHYEERALERGAPVSLTTTTRCWEVKLSTVGNTRITVWRKNHSQVNKFDTRQTQQKAKRKARKKASAKENAWDTAVVTHWSVDQGEGVILPETAFENPCYADGQPVLRTSLEGVTDLAIGQTVRFKWSGKRAMRLRVQRLGGFRHVPKAIARIVY